MKKILLLTGNELRHDFFRKYVSLSKEFVVVKTFCETTAMTLEKLMADEAERSLSIQHLHMRRQSEIDFFQLFCQHTTDSSNSEQIAYGEINSPEKVAQIISLDPDLIICYGASIIRSSLIEAFEGRFLNIHLGLSPYYRGAGTNFWPFVNDEPEYAGVTFMQIDRGIDTGKILHQMQAEIHMGDTVHQIGNRLIRNLAEETRQIIVHFDNLQPMSTNTSIESTGKVYRKKDFTEEAVKKMYQNFNEGMIEKYLSDKQSGKRKLAIVGNPGLSQILVVI